MSGETGGHDKRAARGLRSRAIRGSAWTFGSYAIGNVLRLGSNLVLAYVLFPEAFALTALAGIVLQALQMFSDVGIGPAIVHSKRGDDAAFLNTAWTMQSIRGVLLWLASAGVAWPMAIFYDAPDLIWVIPACGLTCIVTGLQSTAIFTRARDIQLGLITVLVLVETIVKTVITVVWALIWPSVWALIGGSLISFTLFTIATHTIIPGARNRFAWDGDAVRSLARFGRWVFASTAMTFFAMQFDRLILGKLAPLGVLGVYSIAYMFSKLPQDIGSRLATQVLFPALAEVVRRDSSLLGIKLAESRALILAISQFGIVGIIIASPWFFTLLYDARYADAAIFAPLLAGTVWISILQMSADRALLALGDAKSLALSNAANCIMTLGGCISGHWLAGMPGFIAGVGLGNAAGHGMIVIALRRHGVSILRQDFLFTGLVVGIASFTVVIPLLLTLSNPLSRTRIALGAVGLLISAGYAYQIVGPLAKSSLRKLLEGRRRRTVNEVRSVEEAAR